VTVSFDGDLGYESHVSPSDSVAVAGNRVNDVRDVRIETNVLLLLLLWPSATV
jgi:hypothetical protein